MTVHGTDPSDVVLLIDHMLADATSIIIEVPKTRKRAQGFADDLAGLRKMVKLVKRVAKRHGTPVLSVLPEQWKGNVPKEITARRALALLSPHELAKILDDSDDTTDAIGIGLVALCRAKRGVT